MRKIQKYNIFLDIRFVKLNYSYYLDVNVRFFFIII